MISIKNIPNNEPYNNFVKYYDHALSLSQNPINAVSISSFNKEANEVDSRFVNLKYILDDKWIFFTNYESPKARSFETHKQISALIFWESINVQIRIKAKINKISSSLSDKHFKNRDKKKNALAISSKQSKKIDDYETVIKNFEKTLQNADLGIRPEFWGGYAFVPYYFEFWKGQRFRLNSRDVFELIDGKWDSYKLQP